MGRYALNLLLFRLKDFKLYVTLSGFFKRKLELFAIHFVRPFPHESIIWYYDFIDRKSQLVRA